MVASVISTETVTWDTIAEPAAQNITVPATATAVYVFWAYNVSNTEGVASATLGGVAYDELFNHPGGGSTQMAGCIAWYNPATGVKSLDINWTWGVGNAGRTCIVAYVKDGDYTTGWRNAVGDSDTGSTALSVSLSTNTTDLVLKYDTRYETGETPPGTTTGYTSIATHGNNDDGSRLSSCDSPGASSTTITSEDEFYSVVVAVSIVSDTSTPTAYPQLTQWATRIYRKSGRYM